MPRLADLSKVRHKRHSAPGRWPSQKSSNKQVIDGMTRLIAFVATQKGRTKHIEIADRIECLVTHKLTFHP